MERKRFVDAHAVRYKSPRDALQRERHVAKRKQRNRDLEIVFNPESHKDFVTGFRKRKQQRRKEAVRSLEKLQRENKLEERAERREARREQFDLKCDGEDSIDGNSARGERDCENPKNVEQVFDGHETRSTVKVSVITTEFEEDEKQDKRMKTTFNSNVGSSSKSVEVDRQKKNGTGHKLSKTALAVLSNTKLKIEGKRKFSVHNAKKNMKSGSLSKGNDRHKKGRK